MRNRHKGTAGVCAGLVASSLFAVTMSCKKSTPTGSEKQASGSPNEVNAAAAEANDKTVCDAASLEKHFAALSKTVFSYYERIDAITSVHDMPCAEMTLRFKAMAPFATQFAASTAEAVAAKKKFGPQCEDEIKQISSTVFAPEMKARFGRVSTDMQEAVQRCESHPGFREAVDVALAMLLPKRK